MMSHGKYFKKKREKGERRVKEGLEKETTAAGVMKVREGKKRKEKHPRKDRGREKERASVTRGSENQAEQNRKRKEEERR